MNDPIRNIPGRPCIRIKTPNTERRKVNRLWRIWRKNRMWKRGNKTAELKRAYFQFLRGRRRVVGTGVL